MATRTDKNMNILTKEQAETLEFKSLTWPYTGIEKPMLEKVVADMKSGNIQHAVVRVAGGLEVWRG